MSEHVVVIGAGHNGLVCACALAAGDVPVTVLDQAARPGGGLTSGETTLPGFVHDQHAGFLPVTHGSPAMRELPLERHGVDWIRPDSIAAHPFDDGTAIALHRDVERTAASLDAASPCTGAGWRELMETLLPQAEPFARSVFGRFPPMLASMRLAAALRTGAVELTRRSIGSAESFGTDVLGSSRATAWFAGSGMHSGLEPRAAASGAFSLLLKLLGHHVSWPFPRGGAGRLTDALVSILRERGGRLRCDARVERILVRGGRVAGVALAGGEEVSSSAVVSTLTAGPLAKMLPADALPQRILDRLGSWRYGPGVFKVDYALSGQVPWSAAEAREAAVVHVAGDLPDLLRATQQTVRGEVPDAPAMVVGQHTLLDSSRAPASKHTLYTYTHVPPGGRAVSDEDVVERMERQLERFAPGVGQLVLGRDVRSPERIERENPSLVGGDLAGGTMEIDQQLVFRPSPELVRYRTPLRGLYVAGASVHPGGAVHGASGRGAARSLMEDRSSLRFWRRA